MNQDLVAYYGARAAEYERVYQKPERQADLRRLHERSAARFRGHDVLEVSCGTGFWTQSIAATAKSVVACDINDRVLDVARAKPWPTGNVEFAQADSYALPEFGRNFTAGFSAFWWSHIPRSKARTFLDGFHARLNPGAEVMLIDNRYVEGSSTPVSRADEEGNTFQRRQLADGRDFEILKNFPSSEELLRSVDSLAATAEVTQLEYFWILNYRTPR